MHLAKAINRKENSSAFVRPSVRTKIGEIFIANSTHCVRRLTKKKQAPSCVRVAEKLFFFLEPCTDGGGRTRGEKRQTHRFRELCTDGHTDPFLQTDGRTRHESPPKQTKTQIYESVTLFLGLSYNTKHITHFNNARSPASPNDLSSVSFMFDLVLDRLDVRTDNYCLCDL